MYCGKPSSELGHIKLTKTQTGQSKWSIRNCNMAFLHVIIFTVIFVCIQATPCHIIIIRPPTPPTTRRPNNGTGIDPRMGRLTASRDSNEVNAVNLLPQDCGKRHITTANPYDGESTYGAHPWQAYLTAQNKYIGSGALIDRYHIITAAHKVAKYRNNPRSITIRMGVHNPTKLDRTETRTAASLRIHGEFNQDTLINDIAIIRLQSPFTLDCQTNIGTVCLPPNGKSYVGLRCTVSGWGSTSFNANDAAQKTQRQVSVQIVSQRTCRASMAQQHVLGSDVDKFLHDREICAGGQANKDACSQDGGAPLVCRDISTDRHYVAGLVIWGKECGKANVYGVYVDVAKYRGWISSKINDMKG